MSHCRGQVLSFTSRALRYEAQFTSNKDWKTLCKAQKMDIMTLFNTKLYGVNSVHKYLSCAANRSEDGRWKVQAHSYPAFCDEDRSCQWIQCWNLLTQTSRSQLRPLWSHKYWTRTLRNGGLNIPRLKNYGGTLRYVGKKQKVRALNAAQVSGHVRSEAASFCEWLQQTSKTVNLIPFSWTCRNVLNHIFHYGSIATVAAARVYCPG